MSREMQSVKATLVKLTLVKQIMLICHCSICQQSFSENCTVSALLCGHVFHSNCLTMWLNNKSNCPQCRSPNVGNYIKKLFFDKMSDNNNSFINENNSVNEENFKLRSELDKLKDLNYKITNELKIKSESNENLKKKLDQSQSTQMSQYLSFTNQIYETNETNERFKMKLDKLKFMNDILKKSKPEIDLFIQKLPKDEPPQFQIEKLCSALVTCQNDLNYYKKNSDEISKKLARTILKNSTLKTEIDQLKEKMSNTDSNFPDLNTSELLDTPVTAMRTKMRRQLTTPEMLLSSPDMSTNQQNEKHFRQKLLENPFRCTPKRSLSQKSSWKLDIMINRSKPTRLPPPHIIRLDSDTENHPSEEPVRKLKKVPRSKHIKPIKKDSTSSTPVYHSL
uniref:TRAF interacting protein n=1 Tax=Schmidtea mediterranea TaxID=79327 RepID=I1ZI75_SCHMD|nr:TRAF interacting protein [Schmidtea mediterranea]